MHFRAFWFWSACVVSLGAANVAQSACILPGLKMSTSSIERFVDNPASLLSRHPNADPGLVLEARAFAVERPETLSGLIAASRRASQEQSEGLGLGMGRASAYCLGRDPDLARRIASAVRSFGDRNLALGYRIGLGDDYAAPSLGGADGLRSAAGPEGRSGTRLDIGPDMKLDGKDLAPPNVFDDQPMPGPK